MYVLIEARTGVSNRARTVLFTVPQHSAWHARCTLKVFVEPADQEWANLSVRIHFIVPNPPWGQSHLPHLIQFLLSSVGRSRAGADYPGDRRGPCPTRAAFRQLCVQTVQWRTASAQCGSDPGLQEARREDARSTERLPGQGHSQTKEWPELAEQRTMLCSDKTAKAKRQSGEVLIVHDM